MMKKIVMILTVVLLSFTAYAQQNNDNAEARKEAREQRAKQIETQKIAYMTQALELTVQQSQEFWPIYNQYDAEVQKLFRERRKLHRNLEGENATKEDIDLLLDKEAAMVEVRRSYVPSFVKVLSVSQAARIFVAEENFKQELVRSLRKKE